MNENTRNSTRNTRNIRNISIEKKDKNIDSHEKNTENTETGNMISQIGESIIQKGGTTQTGEKTVIAEIMQTAETTTTDETTTGTNPDRILTAVDRIEETTIAGMTGHYKKKTPTTKNESRLKEPA
jgi:hypothetical protein